MKHCVWLLPPTLFALVIAQIVRRNRRRRGRSDAEFERDLARWYRVKHLYLGLLAHVPVDILPTIARPVIYDAAEREPAARRREP